MGSSYTTMTEQEWAAYGEEDPQNAATEPVADTGTRETEDRKDAIGDLRLTLAGLGRRLTCDVVAFVAGRGDSKLLVCRGYIVLPNQELFMEHWWTRANGRKLIFDPLLPFFTQGMEVERLEISALPADAYEGVGSFDCLAMEGECVRGPHKRCEWCVARKKLEKKGLKAYELQINPIIETEMVEPSEAADE